MITIALTFDDVHTAIKNYAAQKAKESFGVDVTKVTTETRIKHFEITGHQVFIRSCTVEFKPLDKLLI